MRIECESTRTKHTHTHKHLRVGRGDLELTQLFECAACVTRMKWASAIHMCLQVFEELFFCSTCTRSLACVLEDRTQTHTHTNTAITRI